jgi:hypothetical protein
MNTEFADLPAAPAIMGPRHKARDDDAKSERAYEIRLITRQPLVPPKPKEFDIAVSIGPS